MPEPAATITLRRCHDCGTLEPAARAYCAHCGGDRLAEEDVDGAGIVVSWTIVRRPATAFAALGAIPIALVRLDAGATVTGRFADTGTIRPVGERVRVVALSADGVAIFS